jgi:UDP-N-acetylglucosamine--N-acetylmuramyl-(pentapeptide) pyrophosphoryl-undecaprenol N-acetylglucosamine transferase
MKNLKVIISGGGTGGHIFPAIAIANALKIKDKSINILFVGAKGKMEMEKVPNAGYPIKGLPIAGLQRNIRDLRNILFPFKLIISLIKSYFIVSKFKPDVVVGTGGYASGPLLYVSSKLGVPSLIQEQNSYPGITNKLLSKVCQKICVAYENMERFFPKDKIIFSGNPIRQDLYNLFDLKSKAYDFFKLNENKITVLIVGGSLGALTVNKSIAMYLERCPKNVQLIWQTGKSFYEIAKDMQNEQVKVFKFISRMDYAYSVADIVVSRAGASTISELCLVAMPSILIPSPNVAEDHQTKNAMALTDKKAAIMVEDNKATERLPIELNNLINDVNLRTALSDNIKKLSKNQSAKLIAQEVIQLVNNNEID